MLKVKCWDQSDTSVFFTLHWHMRLEWFEDQHCSTTIWDHFKNSIDRNINKGLPGVRITDETETATLWCAWCLTKYIHSEMHTSSEYLGVFVEVLGCPVLDVSFWRGLSQGEFRENAAAGTWHHIPGISTSFKLGTGSEVLRLMGEDTDKEMWSRKS